ncbi:MAG: AMP-binding protein [Maritimibacter sp.]|nr:AMP-binding protein [Maritimibacter sp.]
MVDDAGREVAPAKAELLIGGPMVVPGYWENPEGNAKGFTGGYWVSGDIGSKTRMASSASSTARRT